MQEVSTKMQELPVIFRVDKYGKHKEVTAVFPTLPGSVGKHDFTCYAHVGQHGAASYDWYAQRTRPAKPEEYADLLAELRGIYETGEDAVRLKVCSRMTPQHRAAYNKEYYRKP